MQRIAIGQRIRVVVKHPHAQAVGTVIGQSRVGGYFVRLDTAMDTETPIFFYAEEVVPEPSRPEEVPGMSVTPRATTGRTDA